MLKNQLPRSVILNTTLGLLIGLCVSYFVFPADAFDAANITPVAVVKTSDELENVTKEFKKIESRDDKILIYKLFSGSAEYLKNCITITETAQFDPILGKVQTSYGWNREKYSSFTDAVSDYLISVDYDTPKILETPKQRQDFSKIFENLAEATKYE